MTPTDYPDRVRALLEAATPGPWHMEHASKAPPGDEWGEVVASLHPAGGAGRPVPGMRLTWSRRSVGVIAQHNAALIAEAPTLARAYLAACEEVERLRAASDPVVKALSAISGCTPMEIVERLQAVTDRAARVAAERDALAAEVERLTRSVAPASLSLANPFEDCGPGARRVTGRESASQEAWDRQAELLDGADLPDVEVTP